MFTPLFWKDTIERAISTAAQAVLLVSGLSEEALGVINQGLTLNLILSAAVGGFSLAVLKALAATQLSKTNSASFTVDAKETK